MLRTRIRRQLPWAPLATLPVISSTHPIHGFHCTFRDYCCYLTCGWGQGGGRPGEKGAGGVREAGEKGAGSGIPKMAGSGRKREKLRNIRNISLSKKCKGAGARREPGLKGTGSGRFKPPCPPPLTFLGKRIRKLEARVDLRPSATIACIPACVYLIQGNTVACKQALWSGKERRKQRARTSEETAWSLFTG